MLRKLLTFMYSFHTYLKLINIVECVKYPKDVDPELLCLLTEVVNGVVGQPMIISRCHSTPLRMTYEEYATPLAPRSSIWKGMFGMAFLIFRRRSQGSSYKNRIATSKVAPPQHSRLKALLYV